MRQNIWVVLRGYAMPLLGFRNTCISNKYQAEGSPACVDGNKDIWEST